MSVNTGDAQSEIKGRDAVRKALISAAARCFAERGIGAVSVREIAKEAGVNHGLVHRHFGSKDGLVHETLATLAASVETRLGHLTGSESLAELIPKIFGGTQAVGLHWRVVTHALLEGMSVDELQQSFPVFQRLVDAAERAGREKNAAVAQATLIFATGLGYMVFEPYLKGAVKAEEVDWEEIRPHLMGRFLNLAT